MNSDFKMFTVDLQREIRKLMIEIKCGSGKCYDGKKPRTRRNTREGTQPRGRKAGKVLDIITLRSCLKDGYSFLRQSKCGDKK